MFMLAHLLLSAFSTAGPASPSAADVEQLEKDKAIIRVLDGATDDYKSWVSKECPREDHDTANLAARAAAMSEERAIRTRNLAKEVDPADRAEYERAAAELFIEATDFWLKAVACRPSRSMYLEHAEFPLQDAEGLAGGDAALSMSITERRKSIARFHSNEAAPSKDLPRCRPGDHKSAELAARHASQATERAAQVRTQAEMATTDGTTKPAGAAVDAARLLVEAAHLWVRAWECHPTASHYLDNAKLLLEEAEELAPRDALSHQTRDLKTTIEVHRAKMWTDRFSLRIETGSSSGRLAWLKHQTHGSIYEHGYRGHGGAYFGLSALLRVPPRTGPLNFLVGPYYTYWRATQHSYLPQTKSANVHEFGAKVEISVGFTPRLAKFFTIHPGLEFGLQHINFDGQAVPGELVDAEYLDITGGAVGMSLGVCLVYSSICAMSRVHSVPQVWKHGRPTLQAGIAIDLVRLTHAVLERKSLRLRTQ